MLSLERCWQLLLKHPSAMAWKPRPSRLELNRLASGKRTTQNGRAVRKCHKNVTSLVKSCQLRGAGKTWSKRSKTMYWQRKPCYVSVFKRSTQRGGCDMFFSVTQSKSPRPSTPRTLSKSQKIGSASESVSNLVQHGFRLVYHTCCSGCSGFALVALVLLWLLWFCSASFRSVCWCFCFAYWNSRVIKRQQVLSSVHLCRRNSCNNSFRRHLHPQWSSARPGSRLSRAGASGLWFQVWPVGHS